VPVPRTVGSSLPLYGIIAVSHASRGEIICNGWLPPPPRAPGSHRSATFDLDVLHAAAFPSPVPAPLLWTSCFIVWVDLRKARQLGLAVAPGLPGRSIISISTPRVPPALVALALDVGEVDPAPHPT
jgi:hypothetical protein